MSSASNRQYEALARSIIALASLRAGGPRAADLCMHKALLPDAELEQEKLPADKSETESWLAEQIVATQPERVLDIGCGFGSLLATLLQQWRGLAIGINASAYPVQYGARFWQRKREDAAPILRRGAFGCSVSEAPFDAVVAVESLGYCEDLDDTMEWLASLLNWGGQAWILDDWSKATLADGDTDLQALCRAWRRSRLYARQELLEAAAGRGLVLSKRVRLTDRVPAARKRPAAARGQLLRFASHLGGQTSLGQLGAAFLGGWHLESLYARGLAEYELLVLERTRRG